MRTLTTYLPALSLATAGLLSSGCSIISPAPLWEVVKATGGLTSLALSQARPEASNTIYHLHAPVTNVCIEYNPKTQVPDIVPALQAELRTHGIDSRVYDNPAAARLCNVWLEYSAHFEWGLQPFSTDYQPYVHSLQLTLRTREGALLSTSEYQLDTQMGKGKWTNTRTKVAPVVTALVTGFQD